MNINKILIVLCCFLTLLVTISGINNAKNNRYEHTSADNELFMSNMRHVPEIIRSYEKVKDVYGKKNILFFRYVHNSFDSYQDACLNEILALQEEIGKEHIWIFPVFPIDRNSRIRLGNELGKFNYRNIPADSLLIPIYDGVERSYFAWLNNDGEIDMIFLPDKNRVQHTRNYFREVKNLLKTLENEE